MSGETTADMLKAGETRPDFVMRDVAELAGVLRG